jgi:hypothetical protein
MYTVEIYRADKRTKAGEKLVYKEDRTETDRASVERIAANSCKPNERYEVHQTMVTKRSAMAPFNEFEERYDTPYYCSPSSETYWSM